MTIPWYSKAMFASTYLYANFGISHEKKKKMLDENGKMLIKSKNVHKHMHLIEVDDFFKEDMRINYNGNTFCLNRGCDWKTNQWTNFLTQHLKCWVGHSENA